MGKILEAVLRKIEEDGILHFTLIDPDPQKQTFEEAGEIARKAEIAGTDAIMVGGSTIGGLIDQNVQSIKANVSIPVILFPGNISGLSQFADATFFMSVLNSRNPYWITGAQVLGAPTIKSWGLETISLAYLILQPGGTAGFVGDANLLSRNKPELVASYALAGQYMGFDLVYLEAGSGANENVPAETVAFTSRFIEIPLVVGGGINTPEVAMELAKAGASIVVQGTFVEHSIRSNGGLKLKKIIEKLKSVGMSKATS